MTTATAPRGTELMRALEDLQKLAIRVADAEIALTEAAKRPEWTEAAECLLDKIPTRYYDAVRAEVENALRDARGEHGMSDWDGLQTAQSIQDAIDVLELAMERDDSA